MKLLCTIIFAVSSIWLHAQSIPTTAVFTYGTSYVGARNNLTLQNAQLSSNSGITNVMFTNVSITGANNDLNATALIETNSGTSYTITGTIYAKDNGSVYLWNANPGQQITIAPNPTMALVISGSGTPGVTQNGTQMVTTVNAIAVVKYGVTFSLGQNGQIQGNNSGLNADFGSYSESLPVVITTAESTVTNVAAVWGGSYTAPVTGTYTVNASGVVWGTTTSVTATPSVTGTTQTMSNGATFSANSPTLTPSTTYYYRAYVTLTSGSTTSTYQGLLESFTTCPNTPLPTVANNAQSFCQTASPSIASIAASTNTAGGSLIWYADNTTTTPLLTSLALANGTYYVSQLACVSVESARIAVSTTVYTASVAGTISYTGLPSICIGTSKTIDLNGSNGSIQWQESSSNATFTNVSSGGTASSYTITGLTNTNYYRATVTNGVCSGVSTSSLMLSIDSLSNAGSIIAASGNSVCTGNTKDLELTGYLGAIQWQSATALAGPYSNIVLATNESYTSGALFNSTFYRAVVTNGSCPSELSIPQTIDVDALTVAGTISGSNTVCSGTTSDLTLSGSTGTIVWTQSSSLNGIYTSIGNPNSSITTSPITSATYYKAQLTNGACTTELTPAFAVSPIATGNLGIVSSITGPGSVSTSTTNTYSIPLVANADAYIWDMPAGLTITAYLNSGATVNVTATSNFPGGQIKVKAALCSQETSWKTKNVYAPNSSGISISSTYVGAPVICGGTTGVTFNATALAGANYSWTLPAGLSFATGYDGDEQSIQVDFAAGYLGGLINCTRSTATTSLSASYAVNGMPTPGIINGSSMLCGINTTTYTIAEVPNSVSYQWQLPVGMSGTSLSTSISPSWSSAVSGAVKVRAIGTCGTSAWRTLNVGAIQTPGGISGPTLICGAALYTISNGVMTEVSQTTLNYSVANTSGLSYNWTVPTGMTIISGNGSNAIVVSVDPSTFVNGSVSVTATSLDNPACVSPARTLAVIKAVSTISGPTSICGLTSATYSAPAGSGSNFTWSLPSWMTPASGYTLASNPINVVIDPAGTSIQSISVLIETSCGNVTVTRAIGCGLYTQLSSASCGSTLEAMSTAIGATAIATATAYKFKICIPSLSTSTFYYVTSTDRWFALNEASGIPLTYNTLYDVNVSVNINNTWGAYGATCSVSTPELPIPALTTLFCGSTLSTVNSSIAAINVPEALMYKYKISILNDANYYYVESSDRWFSLVEATGLPIYYSTSYQVAVAIQLTTGVYGSYGNACTVSTPELPVVSLSTSSCGSTLSSFNAALSTSNVPFVSTYRFTITPNGSSIVYIVESTDRWFTLNEAVGIPLIYGQQYSVVVDVQDANGAWSVSGSACTVTTSYIPTTTLTSAYCNATLASLTAALGATAVNGASLYEFRIVDPATGEIYKVQSIDRWMVLTEGQNIDLQSVYPVLMPTNDHLYYIDLRVQNNGNWSDWGGICPINTPPNPQGLAQQDPQLHEEQTEGLGIEESSNVNGLEENQLQNTTWTATATSNPFAHSFQIKLNGAEGIENATEFTTQLTDMSGKVYSQAMLSKEQLEAESFGEQLAPGMYLMTLRQGEEMRVIRVVKR